MGPSDESTVAGDVAYLRDKAQHCRELAAVTQSLIVKEELLKIAREFDAEADRIEDTEAEGDPPHQN